MFPSEYTAQRARALDRMNLPDIEVPLNVKVLWLDIMHAVDKEARSYSGTHTHSFYELHFVFAGRAVYECEQDTVTLREGQAALLTPHTPHRFVRADADLFKVSLAFAPDKVGAASLSLDRCGYRTFAVTNDIVRAVDRILQQAAEGDIFTPALISSQQPHTGDTVCDIPRAITAPAEPLRERTRYTLSGRQGVHRPPQAASDYL